MMYTWKSGKWLCPVSQKPTEMFQAFRAFSRPVPFSVIFLPPLPAGEIKTAGFLLLFFNYRYGGDCGGIKY